MLSLSTLRAAALATFFVVGCSSHDDAAPVTAEAVPALPEPPCAEIGPSREEVSVRNEYGTVRGTLEVPAGCAGMPVALVVGGSSTTDRDGNGPGGEGPGLYGQLARALGDVGIATLRYDDPGAAGSRNALPRRDVDIRYELEIETVRAWLQALRRDPRFGAVIGVGHSQGALSLTIASEVVPLDGLVALAGAGRPAGRLLLEQAALRLAPAQLAQLESAVAQLERGELPGPLPAPLDDLLPAPLQPYFASWMKYDPAAELARAAPAATLLVQGVRDRQVAVRDAEILSVARPSARLVLVEDMGHALRRVTDGAPSGDVDTRPDIPLHPAVVPAIAELAFGIAVR
jgi:fermentation-respiration switch protein FrsA (DUF1100 family)